MPYASAGVRELWFGASSAAAVPGFGEARSRAGGARPLSVGLLTARLLALVRADGRDIRGTRAAAGALHVTVAGDTQH
jgi:hypothetical protein